MADTAVVTACYGGYDALHSQTTQDIDIDWVAFTDDPDLAPPAPWTPMVATSTDHPRMAAKRFKLSAATGHRHVIWIDANTEVTAPSFAREALAARRNGIAVWRHPQRDCIYAEAKASLRLAPAKYHDQPIIDQVMHYRSEGHPRSAGLYACGTVAWDWGEPSTQQVADAWLAECERWSYQDQLSLPVVIRRLGVTPGVFPLCQIEQCGQGWLGNRWQRIHPHLSES